MFMITAYVPCDLVMQLSWNVLKSMLIVKHNSVFENIESYYFPLSGNR